MKIKKLKENQTYKICIYCLSSDWSDEDGAGTESRETLFEVEYSEDIQKVLNNYGLDFEKFESYKETGLDEENRFEYSEIVKEEGKKYIQDYSVYISIMTEDENIEVEE